MRPQFIALFLALTAFQLSGCLSDEPSTTEPLQSVNEEPVSTLLHLVDMQEVVLNKIQVTAGTATSVGLPGGDNNCINYEKKEVRHAQNLTVEATWDAVAPIYETLELLVDGSDQARIQGTSPLTVELKDLGPHPFFESILVMMQLPRPGGVAIDQPIHLEIHMDYEGQESVQPRPSGCTWG